MVTSDPGLVAASGFTRSYVDSVEPRGDGWALLNPSWARWQLSRHVAPETHAAVIELTTRVHPGVDGVVAEVASLRSRLARELAAMGLAAAAAGTHPLTVWEETEVSGAARYRLLEDSIRGLARREPTMALHVHVGVPDAEDAIRLLNGLRRYTPVLLALSVNSPFSQGRDGGFASARTPIFQAFPRTGLPRFFESYADYVGAVDALIASGAVSGPSFLWWDVRLQPALGTVEVRVMEAPHSGPRDARQAGRRLPAARTRARVCRRACSGAAPRGRDRGRSSTCVRSGQRGSRAPGAKPGQPVRDAGVSLSAAARARDHI
jgi:YbdK family carboxylate-amine ligase